MAIIEPLIKTSELHQTKLTELMQSNNVTAIVKYDPDFDTVRLLFVPPETPTFVHYVDGGVALICEVETLEIVGLHIEAFSHSFMPRYADVARVWSSGQTFVAHNYGELLEAEERKRPAITREIVRASKTELRQARDPFDLRVLA